MPNIIIPNRKPSDRMGEARAKWNHAKAELERLVDDFRVWSESNPFDAVFETDLKTGQEIIRFVILDVPPTEWSIRIGHIADDFRSALNYVINAAATRESDANSFPIFVNRVEYLRPGKGKRAKDRLSPRDRYLVNVPEPLRQIVDTYQPYQRGHRARQHPLARLSLLTNTDEHQRMAVAHVVYRQTRLNIFPLPVPNKRVEFKMAVQRVPFGQPLYDGMEIARVTVIGPRPKLAIDGQTRVEIAFGEGRIGLAVVRQIESYVIEIIEAIDAANQAARS